MIAISKPLWFQSARIISLWESSAKLILLSNAQELSKNIWRRFYLSVD